MNHLKEVKMTYFQHFLYALGSSLNLIKAAFFLTTHALFPNIFIHSGSELVNKIHYDMMKRRTKNRILVRFNTKWPEDIKCRKWRVLVNGEERLAHDILITIPCKTIQEDVPNVGTKWHFLCYGNVVWCEDSALIN